MRDRNKTKGRGGGKKTIIPLRRRANNIKERKIEKKSHSLPLHFLSRTNKENHIEETRRVREDLDIERQDKRRRKPRRS
jgi:hypothetical protein